MIMEKGSLSIFVVGLGIGIVQQRLAEEKAYLEHLDLERGDPSFNKTIEERIIWGELSRGRMWNARPLWGRWDRITNGRPAWILESFLRCGHGTAPRLS